MVAVTVSVRVSMLWTSMFSVATGTQSFSANVEVVSMIVKNSWVADLVRRKEKVKVVSVLDEVGRMEVSEEPAPVGSPPRMNSSRLVIPSESGSASGAAAGLLALPKSENCYWANGSASRVTLRV